MDHRAHRQIMTLPTRAALAALDAADPLAAARARFALPERVIYLDGNLPCAMPARLAAVIAHKRGNDLIGRWNDAG
jgi:kynureninase